MSNRDSENYLDQLLNSLSGNDEKQNMDISDDQKDMGKEDLEFDDLMDSDDFMGSEDFDEDEFLREFEKNLEDEEPFDFDEDLSEEKQQEQEVENLMRSLKDIDPEPITDSDFEGMEALEPVLEEPVLEEPMMDTPVREEPMMDTPVLEEPMMDTPVLEEPTLEELPLTEDGEVDLSGMIDANLMDLLSEVDGLSDIGEILNEDGNVESVENLEAIEAFANQEMNAQAQASMSEQQEKPKKKGFFAKLKMFFFGPDEEPEEVVLKAKGVSAEQLSAENEQILAELDAEDKKKQKKQKPKKEKAPKEPKPKKEKPKKEPKPKKEKPVKPEEKIPPLPKLPVFLIFVMAASLGILIYLSGIVVSYRDEIKQATICYNNEDYMKAHEVLAGLTVKPEDEQLYHQVMILSTVESKIVDYHRLEKEHKDLEAADALILALGRCDNHREDAGEYECLKELEKLEGSAEKLLKEKYQISKEEAMELYSLRTRKAYTLSLQKLLKEKGF